MGSDFFIAVYTAYPKRYCDEKFFKRLGEISLGAEIAIIENSQNTHYFQTLYEICKKYLKNYTIEHISVNNGERVFLRSVTLSLKILREKFLNTDKKYFVILESDVLPIDDNVLKKFKSVVDFGDIIGGLYYRGFHDDRLWGMEDKKIKVKHVLSGCTLYKRDVIEHIPFRCDLTNPDAFPDAIMSQDAEKAGYRLINYTGIKCDHLHKEDGGRGHDEVN